MKRNDRGAALKQWLDDSHFHMIRWQILTGILCAVVCVAAVTGVSWAWFSNTVSTKEQNLSVATYEVKTSVQTVSDKQNVEPADGSYALGAKTAYEVTLMPMGTAQKGYAVVTLSSEDEKTSSQIIDLSEVSGPITFTLYPSTSVSLQVAPQWGTVDENEKWAVESESIYQVADDLTLKKIEAIPTEEEEPKEDQNAAVVPDNGEASGDAGTTTPSTEVPGTGPVEGEEKDDAAAGTVTEDGNPGTDAPKDETTGTEGTTAQNPGSASTTEGVTGSADQAANQVTSGTESGVQETTEQQSPAENS